MMIIGCDFHPSWQQVSWLDTESGDCGEQKLGHASGEAPAVLATSLRTSAMSRHLRLLVL